ncbi:Fungal pheromone STE3G-protein-coupled receptor [Mycena kentingensis (nom. inval.)]|nr:Fungal pheromone STE3G-protein-coupled receptor [Mycena kentingensis (nom. inval.)]
MPSALPAVPFVGAALVLVTLPHHWRAGNLATLSIIAWLTVLELTYGVNAVIWAGNTRVVAEVWCDIATKIKIGADMALPGCCLCMAKRLNRIAYGLEMSPRGWKHRMLDIALCWGFPALVMILHYIVQGHRFDIIENLGCVPAVYISWPALLILGVSAFLPAVLALVFCILALTKLHRRRVALGAILFKPNPSLTASRYIRLMIMTFALGTWSAVLVTIGFVNEYNSGLLPYVSWEFVHEDFGHIGRFRVARLERTAPENLRVIYLLWGAVSASALAFFLFFGIGKDVAEDYAACGRWVRRAVFRRRCPQERPLLDESIIWATTHQGVSDVEKSGGSSSSSSSTGSYADLGLGPILINADINKQLPPRPLPLPPLAPLRAVVRI